MSAAPGARTLSRVDASRPGYGRSRSEYVGRPTISQPREYGEWTFPARWRETALEERRGSACVNQDIKPRDHARHESPRMLGARNGRGPSPAAGPLRAVERAWRARSFSAGARRRAARRLRRHRAGHPKDYIEAIRAATPDEGLTAIDPDTSMSPRSFEAVLRGRRRSVGPRSDQRQGPQR